MSQIVVIIFRYEIDDVTVHSCAKSATRVKELQRILESVRRDLLQAARQLEKTNAEVEGVQKTLVEKSMFCLHYEFFFLEIDFFS